MALFHLSVTQTKRSAGQSAIASAAYRAGERLYSEYYGEYSDYTRKGGVICSDILLLSQAPPEYADLERVLVIDDRDTPLTLADERIARAIRENNARLVIIDPVQAFLGADVDMNRANEVRPIFRSLGDIAQATGCAIVLIGHLNKAAGTQSTYRGLGSIDITAAVRSLLFIGKLKDSPTTRVLIHEKSSLAPPGQSLAFSLGDEKGFEWIGAYDITADELLAGTDTAKAESKTAQAQMLILELLANGKRGKDGKVFIDTLILPPCLVPSYRHRPMMNSHRAFFIYRRILNEQYRNQYRHLPDCQKADRQDNLYRPCAFQPDHKGDDGGQNQASAP